MIFFRIGWSVITRHQLSCSAVLNEQEKGGGRLIGTTRKVVSKREDKFILVYTAVHFGFFAMFIY